MNKTIKTFVLLMMATMMSSNLAAQTIDTVRLKKKVDPILKHVAAQPDWLYSRLQMYWTTHATDVKVKAEEFYGPAGDRAPVPTVKFNGLRSNGTKYKALATEQLIPYDDDEQGSITVMNPETGAKERVHPSKTGGIINSINRRILEIARDASYLYKATGRTEYAALALPVLDTYLKGIYHRNVPTDITHGHMQTLVGMQTFEVIHEDAAVTCSDIYIHLADFIQTDRDIYDAALKKWAENIIAGGVPHNNWDLFQAQFVMEIALALQSDSHYADGRGREYYLDYIVNKSSIRQWSMRQLADFGFDKQTNIWCESPGYSLTVINEFCQFANKLDREAGVNLFDSIPLLLDALETTPQYLTPNRMFVAFGDSHPNYLGHNAINAVSEYARRHGLNDLEERFARLKRAIEPSADKADIEPYVSASFHAPNVSWLMQRSGMDSAHDLAISLNGSLGNHQHANGISMELYGKGWVMAPDGGIGRTLYSGDDYKEYYSQFPAHNTVCVDGVSSYPVMMSNHAFKVDNRFPTDNERAQFVPATYSQLSFIEPETQAEQVRTTGLVKTSATGGYYVDIFRSRKMAGDDKFHDYFYHNLGQKMQIADAATLRPIDLEPTDDLAFAGGHLYAYSYIYDKQCTENAGNMLTTFTINDSLFMRMWMKDEPSRKIVKALSPVNLCYERMKVQPYKIDEQPVLTFIARQYGEAWTRPFVAIYEPSSTDEPSEIKNVSYFTPKSSDPTALGICVELKNGQTDYIFSSVSGATMKYRGMKVSGNYAVVSSRFKLSDNKLK